MKKQLCFTSIIEIPPEIVKNISIFLSKQKSKEPNDPHFYSPENLHITLLGLIPIGEDINIKTQEKSILQDIFKRVLSELRSSIILQFESFGTINSSVFIKAKDIKGSLNALRKKIIDEVKKSSIGFKYSHMKSYDLGFAWCTIARFNKTNELFKKMIVSEKASFGSFEVKKINIVITDKNYSKENTQKLFSFKIK